MLKILQYDSCLGSRLDVNELQFAITCLLDKMRYPLHKTEIVLHLCRSIICGCWITRSFLSKRNCNFRKHQCNDNSECLSLIYFIYQWTSSNWSKITFYNWNFSKQGFQVPDPRWMESSLCQSFESQYR